MNKDMPRLLRPKSIAVIGGGDVSRYVIENCRKIGFDGEVWHVHPSKGDVRNVRDLSDAPDVAFVGVNRTATLEVIAELRDMGAGGAVAYASGFLEADAETGDGAAFQRRLLDAAGDMTLIGPNCYGFLNYLDGAALWPDQQGGQRVETGVAIITQSSNIAINLTMQQRGLPVAYLVTAGNQAQTGLAEIGTALLQDPRVTALGLHIEGIGDLRAFEALAEASHELGKPIIALKAGRSDQARAATISHTASLAGSATGATALLERLGIGQVASFNVMLETLKLLHVTGPLVSNRIGSMSCSGGEASLMADGAVDLKLEYPQLAQDQARALREALGPKVALANPLDYHTYIWADEVQMTKAFDAMMLGDLALGAVVADFPRTDRCSDADWEPVIGAVTKVATKSDKPMAVISCISETMPEHTATRLINADIVPLCGMNDALRAIECAAWLGQSQISDTFLWLPITPKDATTISEADGKVLLATHGVIVPKTQQCPTCDGLAKAAEQVGYPVVLKAEGVAHKTEAGAVALNLHSADVLLAGASTMSGTGFLVEEMISDVVAELLVGVVLDPAHGYVLTLAAGGTFTEILRDSISLMLPTSPDAIRAALRQLKIAPLLEGYRGAKPAHVESIVAAIMALQDFVGQNIGQIEEVEINPLLCTSTRAVAADVLMRIGN